MKCRTCGGELSNVELQQNDDTHLSSFDCIKQLRAALVAAQAKCARLRKLLRDVSSWTEKGMPQTFREQIAAAQPGAPTCCKWKFDNESDAWETACGNMFVLGTGTPAQNEMRYCPYCGEALSVAAPPHDADAERVTAEAI